MGGLKSRTPAVQIPVALDKRRAEKDAESLQSKLLGALTPTVDVANLASSAFSKLGGAISSAVSAANTYEKAIAEVTTLTDEATFSTERIRDLTLEMTRLYGSDVTTNAKALYQAISAGASSAEDATVLMHSAQKLAIGGVTDITTAVDGLTNVVNAYTTHQLTANDAADMFFVAVREGKTTVPELSANIGQVASIAAQANIPLSEILATVAAITKTGVSTSEAVTQVRSAIVGLIKGAKSGDAAVKALGERFNLTTLHQRGLINTLNDLVNESGASEKQILALLGRVEGLNAALKVAANDGAEANRIFGRMADRAGEADRAMGKLTDTSAHQVDRFFALGDAALSSAGRVITSTFHFRKLNLALNDLLDVTIDVLDWTADLMATIDRGATKAAVWAASMVGLKDNTKAVNDELAELNRQAKLLPPELLAQEQRLLAKHFPDEFGPKKDKDKGKGKGKGKGGQGRLGEGISLNATEVEAALNGRTVAQQRALEVIQDLQQRELESRKQFNAQLIPLDVLRLRAQTDVANQSIEAQRLFMEKKEALMRAEAASTANFTNQMTMLGSQALGGFISNMTQGIATGQVEVEHMLLGFFGTIMQGLGSSMVALGSAAVSAASATSQIPILWPIFGGPVGIGGGIALIAAGTVLSGVGAALGGVSRAASAGAQSAASGVQNVAESAAESVRLDRNRGFSGNAQGAIQPFVQNIYFNQVVGNPDRAAMLVRDQTERANRLLPGVTT